MDNNLARKRFYSRSIQLDFIPHCISLKEVILKQLHHRILKRFACDSDRNQTTNYSFRKIDQVLSLLPHKLILINSSTASSSLVYCCAIAFPLANLCGLTSLQVAQELVAGLVVNSSNSLEELKLQFTVKVIKNGLVEFSLRDCSIGNWLDLVRDKLKVVEADREVEEIAGDFNFFPLQYVYERCCSLLHLGAEEGLIKLTYDDFSDSIYSNTPPGFREKLPQTWSIVNSNPFQYYSEPNNNYFYQAAELNLLRQISSITDYHFSLIRNEISCPDLAVWFQLHFNLSDACLQLLAACPIFGSVAHHNPDLASARLGLIAIVQCYLSRTQNRFPLP